MIEELFDGDYRKVHKADWGQTPEQTSPAFIDSSDPSYSLVQMLQAEDLEPSFASDGHIYYNTAQREHVADIVLKWYQQQIDSGALDPKQMQADQSARYQEWRQQQIDQFGYDPGI